MGLEVAVPVTNGDGDDAYLDIVPLSESATWGNGVVHYVGAFAGYYEFGFLPGTIVAADFNGAGKPSIALSARRYRRRSRSCSRTRLRRRRHVDHRAIRR